jgi:tetratricopeptide (TPR) repeat protein
MNYVDLIIRYLSGELSPDEASSFKEELSSNGELKKEFDDVSAAYNLIRDQVQNRDEKAFRRKLQEAMNHGQTSSASSRHRIRPWWYIPLAVAGSVAILWVLVLNQAGREKIFTRYYLPEQDPVLLAYGQEIRGEQEPGILYYRDGRFSEAMEVLESQMSEEQDNTLLLLYYLLSAMELNLESEVIDRVIASKPSAAFLPDQAICWYTSLALIKSDRRNEAVKMLEPLAEEAGPYQSDAEKLRKMLLK